MRLKQKLPVSYLLFTYKDRLSRGAYWNLAVFYWCTYYVLYQLLQTIFNESSVWFLYPVLFWIITVTAIKRLHDQNKSGWLVLLLCIPVLGPIWLFYQLGFKKGNVGVNKYGAEFGIASDYHKNDEGSTTPELKSGERIIDDVTKLNPILVRKIYAPTTVEELCKLVGETDGPISVGGGRFSMGGQTASQHSLHIDMRKLNKVIDFNKSKKLIKVQAGIRWCDIQQHVDEYDLSIKIMQTYANFTVGGALSVNAHGRYMGLGPVVLSVKSISLVLPSGDLISASADVYSEFFYAAIGGYNAIGVIAEAEFLLADNLAIKRAHEMMPIEDYKAYFFKNIRDNESAIFHNGDIYPPKYKRLRAVTWVETNEKPTVKTRLMPLKESYPLERYFLWSFTETPFGKWRREYLIDPLLFSGKKIHWRNYEAGYDVAELEPRTRRNSTYVLLEYFVPVQNFEIFEKAMAEIFIRYNVNVLNVSIRHAKADPGTLMAWAREEVFAFVVYYKQRTDATSKNKVAVWTRELVTAVIAVNGAYYLPYQVHATADQFHQAYPNAWRLFEMKNELDPTYKFRNVLWDTYYKPTILN